MNPRVVTQWVLEPASAVLENMPELAIPGVWWLLIASCTDEQGEPVGCMSWGWEAYDPPSRDQVDEMIDSYARPQLDRFLAESGLVLGPARRVSHAPYDESNG